MNLAPDATVNIIRNDDKTWHIKFSMTDSYPNSFNPSEVSGGGNKVIIEWQGHPTMYSGSETNDLKPEDY